MAIVTLQPREELRPYVRQFWFTSDPDEAYRSPICKVMADGAPGLIFQHHQGHSAVLDARHSLLPLSFMYGQSTGHCINHLIGSPFILGVHLQPTALKSLFALEASALTDKLIDTDCIFSTSLREQFLNMTHPAQFLSSLSDTLLRLLRERSSDRIIAHSIRLMQAQPSGMDSLALAETYQLSRRQFQRQFKAAVGVCPQTYGRILRFQKALHLLKGSRYKKLSDIGYELGYADQSHFIREFKTFSGGTPQDFLKAYSPRSPFYRSGMNELETLRILN